MKPRSLPNTLPDLPPELYAFEGLSLDQALALVEAFGGTRLYIPSRDTDTKLTEAIGPEGAEILKQSLGGDTIKVPLARAFRIAHYREKGMTIRAIAQKVGCHEDSVDKILRRQRFERDQLRLF